MADLAAIRDRVEQDLKDTGNDIWSTGEIDQQIHRALRAYNAVDPLRDAAVINSSDGEREYSLSSITGYVQIIDVWYPYDDASPPYPPNLPHWHMIDHETLYLDVVDAPTGASDQKIRLLYFKPHTIEDLDGGASTTLDGSGETLVVLGATAYAAAQYAQSLVGKVTVSGWTPKQLMDWAEARRIGFYDELGQLARRLTRVQDARIAWEETI